MTTIAQITKDWQEILGSEAQALASAVGFIRRERKISGGGFALTLMSGWLSEKESSLADLAHAYLNSQGKGISRQGLNSRFNARAAHFMEALVGVAVKKVVGHRGERQTEGWINTFSAVWVCDSTVIRLPQPLEAVWEGTSGSSLKLQVCMDLKHGGFQHLTLHHGRCHDQQALADPLELPAGGLFMADLGYFKLARLAHISQAQAYWLTRYKGGTHLLDPQGQPLDLLDVLAKVDQLDLNVRVGLQQQLPCRLLACRVSDAVYAQRLETLRQWERRHQTQASPLRHALCRWVIYLSNLPPHRLRVEQVGIVYSLRWQMEMLFKRWKSLLHLDQWATHNPWRILCEVYAKLLAILFEHDLMLLAGCHDLACSRVQAHRVIAKHAWALAAAFARPAAFRRAVSHLLLCLQGGWKIATSASSPPTFQKMRTLS
ncbi:MAG: IS4 family transposase [bacterium]|nr:IS4 family transposase [bacterium]